MIKDRITLNSVEFQSFDKMQIALAIKNSTYEDCLSCSLLENDIVDGCGVCNLKEICRGIEDLAEEYYERTSKAVETYDY